jgi:hydroxypyruvate reductase/glycerate 2-kinase
MILHKVLNRSRLIDHGPSKLRTDAIDIIEYAIRAADPYIATIDLVHLKGNTLHIGSLIYDISQFNNIYLLGVGKATQGIAIAIEEILGKFLTDGVIILKRGEVNRLKKVRVIYASHPVPDESSLEGARELVKLARQAGENDLVISVVTGGSSSLVVLPSPGVSLADKQYLNGLLLACGASIREINAVRKHVSLIKGGRLALEVFPANLVVLTVSDVVGDPLDYITDLTVPDSSTYLDAWTTLEKYKLWNKLPGSIRNHLQKGVETESPKSFEHNYYPFILVAGDSAFRGAIARSTDLGYVVTLIEKEIEEESVTQARLLVDQAQRLTSTSRTSRRCALIGRGETIVSMSGKSEKGGPNQEFAVAAAAAIQGLDEIIAASIDLDGTDGPTEFCGAIVDGGTVLRAMEGGYHVENCLNIHASTDFLQAAGDLVFTGPTGTNVNDIMFILMDHTK